MPHHRTRIYGLTQGAIASTLAAAALSLACMARPADAQIGIPHFRCETQVTFENRTRRVFGTDIAAECAEDYPHSPPFGNWGVDSNYGRKQNGFQFAGWHRECSLGVFYCNLRQWNSCTRDFPSPNPAYYNDNNFTTQSADPNNTVAYATLTYRGSPNVSCQSQGGVVSVHGNHMDLWELDGFPAPQDELVAELTYGSVSIPITCDSAWDCGGTSAWLSPRGGDDAVSADIRISVHRYQVICESPETGLCF